MVANAIRRREARLTTRVHAVLQAIGKDVAGAVAARLGLAKLAVDALAHEADHSPSAARRRAGNYRMGHLKIGPLDISIENPAGTRRRPDRPDWPPLPHHYGYVRGTRGADGDHVDCFVRVGTDDAWRGDVFVIDQVTPEGEFDEHKVMLGWRTRGRAVRDYLRAYQPGWQVGPVTRLAFDAFVEWLDGGDTRRPLTGQVAKAGEGWEEEVAGADWEPLGAAVSPALRRQLKAAGVEELTAIAWEGEGALDLINERAAAYAEARAGELIEGLGDSITEQLRSLVADAIAEQWSTPVLEEAIVDSYSFSEDRAAVVARTELSRAYNAGNAEVGRIAGAVGKRWVLGSEHGDDDADECDDNAEDDVIAFDDVFSSGDDFPPAHPNCVCAFESVYADDEGAEDLVDEEE